MRRRKLAYCEKLYAWVLKAYPSAHRSEYGAEMAHAFRDLCQDAYARDGSWGLFNAVLFTLLDAVPSIVAEYTVREIQAMLKRILYSNISSDRTDRSIGPFFAICAVAVFAMAVFALRDMHADRAQFWLGTFAALGLALQLSMLGLLVHMFKVLDVKILQYKRVPGQMLKYYFNFPALFFSAGSMVMVGGCFMLADLHLSEVQFLIGALIIPTLALLCIAIGMLFLIAPPQPAQPEHAVAAE